MSNPWDGRTLGLDFGLHAAFRSSLFELRIPTLCRSKGVHQSLLTVLVKFRFHNGLYGSRYQKDLKYILATLSPETRGPVVMDSNFLREKLGERKAQYLAIYGISLEKQCAMDCALDPSRLEEFGDPEYQTVFWKEMDEDSGSSEF